MMILIIFSYIPKNQLIWEIMMKKIFAILMLFMMFVPSYAEVQSYETKQKIQKIDFGQKIFRKKLQRKCGYTAGHWAQQHTQQEWQSYQTNGTFKDELAKDVSKRYQCCERSMDGTTLSFCSRVCSRFRSSS